MKLTQRVAASCASKRERTNSWWRVGEAFANVSGVTVMEWTRSSYILASVFDGLAGDDSITRQWCHLVGEASSFSIVFPPATRSG
jgi:hypothetical protein